MQISVGLISLQEAIKKVNYIVDSKSTSNPDILITTEDYSSIIVQKCNGSSKIRVTLDTYKLQAGNIPIFIPQTTVKLIEKLKNVDIVTINNEYILADKKKISYSDIPVDQYWRLNTNPNTFNFSITEKEFCRLLSVKYAADNTKENTRPILTGINIQDNRFAALDGYVMSVRESRYFDNSPSITLTCETVRLLDKLLNKKSDAMIKMHYFEDVKTDYDGNIIRTITHVKFIIGDTEIISETLQGDYIKYKSIIPEDFNTTVTLDNTNILIETLEFLKNIKTGDTISVKFDIHDRFNTLTASGSSALNKIEEELDCNVVGDKLEVAFNAEFMLKVLNQYKDKSIRMDYGSPVSPCVVREANYDSNYSLDLVLPVRMK